MEEEPGQDTPQPEEPEQPARSVEPVKYRPKVPLKVQEERLAPKPSLWPFALALALVFTSIGVIVHPVLFICGIVLTVLVIIGWILEKH